MAELDSFLDSEGAEGDLGALPGDLATANPAEPAAPAANLPAAAPAEGKPAAVEPAQAFQGNAGPAKKPPEADPDDAKPVPEDVAGLRSAIQAERAKRNDYKGERDRLQGEAAALKAELEALRRAAATPAPPPVPERAAEPVAIPSPLEDPAGYHAYQEQRLFNERLNMSEAMLRTQHDDADVDAKIEVFKKAAAANPALRAELTRQPHPFRWAYQQAQRIMAMDEIGDDPAAYRARVETELRARLEAEYAAAAPAPGQTRVTLPQSLGTARSAGPRSMPVINVAESFDDILAKRA